MPAPSLVTGKEPETAPPKVKVRPVVTSQMLASPSTRGQFKVRSAGSAVLRPMSMAAAPRVKVLPALMVTGPAGFSMAIPAQVTSAPRTVVLAEVTAFLAVARERTLSLIIVSNEVGLGLVPPYPLGRVYRDLLGRVNQQLAAAADAVYLVVAGIPVELKALEASWANG